MSEDKYRIATIIVHYRAADLVVGCLDSLLPQLGEEDVVLVVDNASGDGSWEDLKRRLGPEPPKAVRLLQASDNGGFSAGNNHGIRQVDAQAYWLLNSDTLVRPGAPERLWQTLQSDPRIGLVGPRLEGLDDTPQVSCFRRPSPLSEMIQAARTGPVRRLLQRWEVPLGVFDSLCEADWVSFASVLVRSEVIRDVGPMDEGFFLFFEDVDYCLRARRSGWKVMHDPAAHVVHLRGGSSPVKRLQAERKRRPRYYYQSRSRYFRKTYGVCGPLMANSCWTLGRILAWLRETVGGKAPHTVERELLDNWRG